jgi:hypothetical protein
LLVAFLAIEPPPVPGQPVTTHVMLSAVDPGGAHVVGCSPALQGDASVVGIAEDRGVTYVAYYDPEGSGENGSIVLARVP